MMLFAGHGMATAEGNILAPIDAKAKSVSGGVTHGYELAPP
jgi:hypothetical protein